MGPNTRNDLTSRTTDTLTLVAYREAAFAVAADFFNLEIHDIDLPSESVFNFMPLMHGFLGGTRVRAPAIVSEEVRTLAARIAVETLARLLAADPDELLEMARAQSRAGAFGEPGGDDGGWAAAFIDERWGAIRAVAGALRREGRLDGVEVHSALATRPGDRR